MRARIAVGVTIAAAGAGLALVQLGGEDCAGVLACVEPPACKEIGAPPPDVRPRAARARDPVLGEPNPFGFNDAAALTGDVEPAQVAALTRLSGGRLWRYPVDWRALEPEPGSYEFDRYDEPYCAALAADVLPVLTIAGAPRWAAESQDVCPLCLNPPAAEHLDELARVAEAVAARYPRVAAIEAWNEPNLPRFWGRPDPAAYVATLAAVNRGVKRGAPETPVLGGSLSNVARTVEGKVAVGDFLAAILDFGALEHMDALSVHPYPTRPIGDPDQLFDPTLQLARSAVGPRLPIWVTETGIPGADDPLAEPSQPSPPVTFVEQARTSAGILARAREHEVSAVLYHALIESSVHAYPRQGFGWVLPTGSEEFIPRPAFCVLSAAYGPRAQCPPNAIDLASPTADAQSPDDR